MTPTTLPRSDLSGLAAIAVGAGHPVVLLHGVGLHADAWQPQIDALHTSYHVIAPDMPGHGESPPPSNAMTLADYVAAYVPILATLPEPALIIGHSMGAMIALELAARHPSKVCAVVALNAIFERDRPAATAVRSRADSLDPNAAPDPTATLTRWFGDAPSPARATCDAMLRAVHPASYKSAYTAFATGDGPARDALRSITCPALFATGAKEPNSTPAMSHAMATLAPQGRALIVPGAAHMMPMTHPAAVNAAIVALAQEVWP